MTSEKFWINKNGVLGTAHLSRNGEVVDFKPARVFFWSGDADPSFELTPIDGWTEPIKVPATKGQAVFVSISENGEVEFWKTPFFAEHLGVRLEGTKDSTVETLLAAQRRVDREKERVAEEKRRKEREPLSRTELESWLDQRMADPIRGGQRSIGRLRRKPSRARWAVGKLIDTWLREFPLPDNQFATRMEVFRALQKRSGSAERFAGGRLVQDAVLKAEKARHIASREVWLRSHKEVP